MLSDRHPQCNDAHRGANESADVIASTHTASNLAAALELAAAGIPIFPARASKRPSSGKWQKQPLVKGWREIATTDPHQLQGWWQRFPDAIPGIELHRAGLVVIDPDRHPDGPDGVSAFAALEAENGGIPAHPETDTAGGGKHHFFRQPEGETFGNGRGALPEGIDVRGSGGWIVAPGAVRSDGARWQPAPGTQTLADAFRSDTIRPLPSWIGRIIRPHPEERRQKAKGNSQSAGASKNSASREAAYATATLNALGKELSDTGPGMRNDALNSAAYRMGRMTARGWIESPCVADVLWRTCELNELVKDDGADGVQGTMASGLTGGMQDPHPDLNGRQHSSSGRATPADNAAEIELLPITLEDLLSRDIKPREFVIEPLIHERGLVMVYTWRGVGKTWFALGLAYAIAAGGKYLKWTASKPRRVLHVCGEMAAVDLKQRFERVVAATNDKLPEPAYLRIISADLHERGVPDLATAEGQVVMDAVLGDAEVVFFDNVSTLFRTGQENEAESWAPVQNWLLKLRREGRAVVIIHHSNKAKAQRGTSKREDVLDAVLNLRAPSDYEPSEGARFEVHFEKARGLSGAEAVSPFEAKLEVRDGAAVWTMRYIEDARLADIEELKNEGLSVRRIAQELGISKSAVQRALSKAGTGDL